MIWFPNPTRDVGSNGPYGRLGGGGRWKDGGGGLSWGRELARADCAIISVADGVKLSSRPELPALMLGVEKEGIVGRGIVTGGVYALRDGGEGAYSRDNGGGAYAS